MFKDVRHERSPSAPDDDIIKKSYLRSPGVTDAELPRKSRTFGKLNPAYSAEKETERPFFKAATPGFFSISVYNWSRTGNGVYLKRILLPVSSSCFPKKLETGYSFQLMLRLGRVDIQSFAGKLETWYSLQLMLNLGRVAMT